MKAVIIFENGTCQFGPGDQVKGIIQCKFHQSKKVTNVSIEMKGFAHTEWTVTETTGTGDERKSIEVRRFADEEYMNYKVLAVGGTNGNITIPAGSANYPFQFMLPHNTPSSYEGRYGHIRYSVKLHLSTPWDVDEVREFSVFVVAPLDLNLNSAVLSQPKTVEFHKTFCCLCCASGPLYLIIKMPVTGFVPGQSIPFIAECDNASNVNMVHLTIALRKKEYFTTHYPTSDSRSQEYIITKIKLDGCLAGGSNNYSAKLNIPRLPPSELKNCGIISVQYHLIVTAEVKGAHMNLEDKIDITIGTIPLTTFNGEIGEICEAEDMQMIEQSAANQKAKNGNKNIGWNVQPDPNQAAQQMPPYPNNQLPFPAAAPAPAPAMPLLPQMPTLPQYQQNQGPTGYSGNPMNNGNPGYPLAPTNPMMPPPAFAGNQEQNAGLNPSAPPLD